MSKNLYNVLGVNNNADVSEIRTAYKQLAREHHPDKGGDPEKFKELSQAHEILSDESKRRHYDMTGSITEQQEGGFQGQGMPFGMPDVFSHMFGFGNGFGQGHGPGQGQKRNGKGPGKTQEIPLRLSDYYHGRNLGIKLGRQCFCKICKGSGGASTKPCEPCNGRGQVNQMINMGPIQMMAQTPCGTCSGKGQQIVGRCSTCSGRGMMPDEKTIDIKVEPGMMPGNTIVFAGLCSDHPGFTEAGDVNVILREAEEDDPDISEWTRDGSKLKKTVTISLAEALLGTTKIVKGHPGFQAGLPLEIPVGVQNIWIGTFSGLGMPIRGTPRFGDALITVLVVPTETEIQALKANGLMMKTFMPVLETTSNQNLQVKVGKWQA
jgi:DnaJ family protein A protein 2